MADLDKELLDDAARAGWLYYVGGRTQDDIARTLGVSRQRAQRLVSKAVSDGLVRIRLEHPIAETMELASRVKDKFELDRVRVAPDLGVDGNMHSVAPFAARSLEGVLASASPQIVGFGTGRYLRAMISQMTKMSCPHHTLVSLLGNIAPDGTASVYEVLERLSDYVDAPHYPLPTPVLAENLNECKVYKDLTAVQRVYGIADQMNAAFVGIGQLDHTAPIMLDGFISEEERNEFIRLGVVGEICGRPYDRDGNYIESSHTSRLTSYQVQAEDDRLVIAIAAGKSKVEAIFSAIKGNIINALITDEPTARALLQFK